MKMSKVYDNANNNDDDNDGQILIREAHLSLWLRWAKNIYGKMQWFATYRSHHIVKEVFDKLELYYKPRGETPQDVEQELNVIGVVSVR